MYRTDKNRAHQKSPCCGCRSGIRDQLLLRGLVFLSCAVTKRANRETARCCGSWRESRRAQSPVSPWHLVVGASFRHLERAWCLSSSVPPHASEEHPARLFSSRCGWRPLPWPEGRGCHGAAWQGVLLQHHNAWIEPAIAMGTSSSLSRALPTLRPLDRWVRQWHGPCWAALPLCAPFLQPSPGGVCRVGARTEGPTGDGCWEQGCGGEVGSAPH